MALPITENARQASNKTETTPSLVFEIDGHPVLFGSAQIFKYIRIGDPGLVIGNDWLIGGYRLLDNQSPYFTFNTGATTVLSQKLDISRAQGSSNSNFVIALVDKSEEITKLASPGKLLTEVLGRNCTLWQGFKDTAWPEDYNPVVRGSIQDIEAGSGFINFICTNAEEKKRTPVFTRTTAKIIGGLDYLSGTFQDLFFQNLEDVPTNLYVNYIAGGTAGIEVVTVIAGNTIQVQIENGVSTASQIKKAILNNPNSNQKLTVKVTGEGDNPQVIGSFALQTSNSVAVADATIFDKPTLDGSFRTYLKIKDELIEYENHDGTVFSPITRGAFGSVPALQKDGDDLTQLWRLQGNAINLALKLMLSGGPEFYKENVRANSFNLFDSSNRIDNAIFFNSDNVEMKYGVARGDLITVELATEVGNNQIDMVILDVGRAKDGSYVIVNQTLTDEFGSNAVVKFKSQYNVWPRGMGLIPAEVDVKQHHFIRDTFLANRNLDIFIDDISNGKDFIERQLYQPLACFSVPRKGRSSVNYHVGPLPTYQLAELNSKTVINAKDIKLKRSTSKNFINKIVFEMDYDPVTETFKKTKEYSRPEDLAQIPVGEKEYRIQAFGLRTEMDGDALADQTALRLLNRYSLGAEYLDGVMTKFGTTFATEIGDVVAADYGSLKISDYETGNRQGQIKIVEVINKTQDNKTGQTKLDLVNTTYGVNDRLGFISPASIVAPGSTTTKIRIKKSYGTLAFDNESTKWRDHYGQNILVHSEDWTQQAVVTLLSIDSSDPEGMQVDPPLPFTPAEGFIVRIPNYPQTGDPQDERHWTQRYAFFDPTVQVVNGVSQTQFEVSPAKVARFYIGAPTVIHNLDFTEYSPEAKVIDITGNIITIDTPTGFALNNNHYVELIGFLDKSPPYRII